MQRRDFLKFLSVASGGLIIPPLLIPPDETPLGRSMVGWTTLVHGEGWPYLDIINEITGKHIVPGIVDNFFKNSPIHQIAWEDKQVRHDDYAVIYERSKAAYNLVVVGPEHPTDGIIGNEAYQQLVDGGAYKNGRLKVVRQLPLGMGVLP